MTLATPQADAALDATIALNQAEEAWWNELLRKFGGIEAREKRYTLMGRGVPGTLLRKAYDHRQQCLRHWLAACRAAKDEIRADVRRSTDQPGNPAR